MTAQPPWAMPTPWNNQDIVLYHGTLDHHAQDILSNGVSLAGANPDADFGPGFYTTTLRRQAEAWAFVKVAEATADGKSHSPGLVEFTASRRI